MSKNKILKEEMTELQSKEAELKAKEQELQSVNNLIKIKENDVISMTKNRSVATSSAPGTESKEITSKILPDQISKTNKYIQTLKEKVNTIKKQIDFIKDEINLIRSTKPEEREETEKKETMEETTIIKISDFKSIVENYNKINLSESDIINILVETQNPIMTKGEIIESVQNKLIFEADMNRDVSGSFESGTNEYSELLGSDLAKQMADKSFNEIAMVIRQKTGKQRVTFDDVQQLMNVSLMNAAREEYTYGIERLEQKAVEMIKKQFNIPEGSVEFDATITGVPQRALGLSSNTPQEVINQYSRQLGVKIGEVQREGLKYERGDKPVPEGKTEEEMGLKVKRRKLTNAMMHGAARKSQNIHHMDDQLRQENPRLGQNYANLMAANDASYWMMNDQDIESQGRQGIHAGNVRVVTGNPPKIIAQGIVFPVLLHELAKGVAELIALHSLPENSEEKQYVYDKADTLTDETNDIRLGPAIWEKFVAQIPTDNQEIISNTFYKLQLLSDEEFNDIINGLVRGSTNAQMEVRRMAEEAIEELEQEAADEALGVYGDEDDEEENTTTPEEDEEEEDDVLKRILSGQKGEEGPEETKDLNDMSDEELEDLIQSAIADEDYEFASQIRDILNSRR